MSCSLKFQDMHTTTKGEARAFVELTSLKTIWFNTGTLCNLTCENCYIESSPTNDRLVYLTVEDIKPYLIEVKENQLPVDLIGFTGGEPFLNPNMIAILETTLSFDHEVLVLTNANRVIKRVREKLLSLKEMYGDKLHLRISLDHYTQKHHDDQRGEGAFSKTLEELQWLIDNNFNLSIAGRSIVSENNETAQRGYRDLLKSLGFDLDISSKLVLFPEMESGRDLPEITTACWDILKKSPDDQMCATERMIVKRKGESSPVVMPCTLLAYDDQFVLGAKLTNSDERVYLNHKFCAEFCVLGGASCSSAK